MVDPNTIDRIVSLAGVAPGDQVLEIGAGPGGLTVALAEAGADVTAIEVDRHLIPVLTEVVGGHPNVEIVEADAASVDWGPFLAERGPAPWHVVANLPYNIATTLVIDLLDQAPGVNELTVMVQAEVARRLAAGPGSRDYGIPSVRVAFHARAELVGRVPPTVFWPQPRVESALVRLTRRPEPRQGVDPDCFRRLVAAAFGQRRKMLRRSLADRVGPAQFAAAGVDPADRPEALDIDAWCRLAVAVAA